MLPHAWKEEPGWGSLVLGYVASDPLAPLLRIRDAVVAAGFTLGVCRHEALGREGDHLAALRGGPGA